MLRAQATPVWRVVAIIRTDSLIQNELWQLASWDRKRRMVEFETMRVPAAGTARAADGSEVRELLSLDRGGMALFELKPGQTSTAVTHRTVEEIWLFVSGRGEMWGGHGDGEEIVAVEPGVC